MPHRRILWHDLRASLENLERESRPFCLQKNKTEEIEGGRIVRVFIQRLIAKLGCFLYLFRNTGFCELPGFVILFR